MELPLNINIDENVTPHMILGGGMEVLIEMVHAFMTLMGVSKENEIALENRHPNVQTPIVGTL